MSKRIHAFAASADVLQPESEWRMMFERNSTTLWTRMLCAAACALGVSSAGCASDEAAATEVSVTVTAHAELSPLLRRVRASVYASDASDGGMPVHTQDFALSADLDAGTQAKLPFSFGITPGRASRFLLVIEGFGSLDPAEAPLVEQKQIGAFTADRAMAMSVLLSASCANMPHPCEGLEQTCWPEARACGPLREAPMLPATDLRGIDASLPSRNPPGCPPDACDPDYPCTPTPPEGYVCLGALADFPMPYFGAKTPPSYDLSEPGVAIDRVTGLAWQRERPERYQGCTGAWSLRGDLCTLDEAKRYCKQLQLGGRAWRLPSLAELSSLIDTHSDRSNLIDLTVFPGEVEHDLWSSSPFVRPAEVMDHGGRTWSWNPWYGVTVLSPSHAPSTVRCVSGVPFGRGTPEQRFAVDEQADTVADRATALTWQRTPTRVAASVDEARAYCATLGPDWRLPNFKELLGIQDLRRSDPALPQAFLKPMRGGEWSDTPRLGDQRAGVLVNHTLGSWLGRVASSPRSITAHVRCVR